MVSVAVIRSGEAHGRRFVRGELIDLEPVEALTLARQGFVSLSPRAIQTASLAPVEPEPEPEPVPVRKRRTYRRRDLVAEQP